jgi:ABC-type antimicrobial peptide transport system permease subunit
VLVDQRPAEIVGSSGLGATPVALSVLLLAVAAAALAHALLVSVRRRRHDFALLKTLGFVPRQVPLTVATRGTVLGLVALAVGLPLGVAAGRVTWTLFAAQTGVIPEPVVPGLLLLAVAGAVLLVSNVVAAVPGLAAAGAEPAVVLHRE